MVGSAGTQDIPALYKLLHAYISFWTKNSHWPLIDVSQDNASSDGNDYHHHDQPQHIPCKERKERDKIRGSRPSYSIASRASIQIHPARITGMDPSHDPGFVPSVPKSFFSLEFICTLWLIPTTGCTAAASLREGKVSAGSNTWSTPWEVPTSAGGTGAVAAVASVERKKRHTKYQALMSTSKQHVPCEWDRSRLVSLNRLQSTLTDTCSLLSCCQKFYQGRQEMYSSPHSPLTRTYLTKSTRHRHRWDRNKTAKQNPSSGHESRGCTMTSFSV